MTDGQLLESFIKHRDEAALFIPRTAVFSPYKLIHKTGWTSCITLADPVN